MFLAIAGILVITYFPGALILRLPVANRAGRAALPADERVFWGAIISIAATTLVALGLAAAGVYSLGRLVMADLLLCAVLLGACRRRLSYGGAAAKVTRTAFWPFCLVALGVLLFYPPADYVMGGKDPGTYVNEGIQIAKNGSIFIADRALAALPADSRSLFVSPDAEGLNQGTTFMGFFVQDLDSGRVVGQFPHAFPVWIAIGYGLFGVHGALCAVGFWALIGILAVYFASARLLGRLPAFAGALLLTINVAEVWFARYPTSELMQQALLFAALLALARAVRDGDAFFGPVAGVLLGVLVFARIDTLLVLMAIGAGMLLLLADGKRARWSFWMPLAVLLAAASAYYTGPMNYYAATPMGFLRGPIGVTAICLSFVTAGLLIVIALRHWPGFVSRCRLWLPRALVVLVVGLFAYGYVWRAPHDTVHDIQTGITVTQGLAFHDAYSLRTFTWYVSAMGLAGAVLGFALVTWRWFWRDPILMIVTLALPWFFFYKARIVPEHFWLARRYLTIILPMTCVLAAAGTLAGLQAWWSRRTEVRPAGSRTHWSVAVSALIGLVWFAWIGWQNATTTSVIVGHVEYAGLSAQLDTLSRRFTDRDLVLVESRGSSDAHVLATPLAYTYGRQVLLLLSPRPDRGQFDRFCQWATGAYEHVYLIADGGTDITPRGIAITPVASQSFEIPEYESLLNAYPSHVRHKKFSLSIFQLTRSSAPVVKTSVDVGFMDDVWVLRFHAKERDGGIRFRWVRNMSFVSLRGLPVESRRVTLRMSSGGRPAQAGVARVQVYLNEHLLGAIDVGDAFHDYSVPIAPEIADEASRLPGASVLRLMCTTWRPRDYGRGSDDRQLGVMLSRVGVER